MRDGFDIASDWAKFILVAVVVAVVAALAVSK